MIFELLFLALVYAHHLNAHTANFPEWKYTFTGYIKHESAYDSRNNIGLDANQFLLFPDQPLFDERHRDINQRPQHIFFTLESRAGLIIDGPTLHTYRPKAVIAADFFGRNIEVSIISDLLNLATMRLAYLELTNDTYTFLCGYFWHPFSFDQYTPNTISNNCGDPFVVDSRNPQIRIGRSWPNQTLSIGLSTQLDYTSDGPIGFDSDYSKHAILPNVTIRYNHTFGNHGWGIAADIKRLTPRLKTNIGYKTDEAVTSGALNIALGLKWPNKVSCYSSVAVGQNMTNFVLFGGYAVTSINSKTDVRTYANLNAVACQTDIEILRWDQRYVPGIFVGCAKNLGSQTPIIPNHITDDGSLIERYIYGIGNTIDHAWRIAPRLRIFYKAICAGIELECTRAAYGTLNNYGHVYCATPVTNIRVLSALYYIF